ncbi:MAG: hypothetical protein AAF387_22625, partial [Pseudomonadota bacterium]
RRSSRSSGRGQRGRRSNWQKLFPPIRNAWDDLGKISPEIANKTGLNPGCEIVCGVHDSNASLALYLKHLGRDFVLASTGTWAILFNPSLSLDALNPSRDMLANIDITGRPIPTARFMGGREFEALAGDAIDVEAMPCHVKELLAQGTMALPTFAPGNGPFAERQGKIIGPEPKSQQQRAALASLYLALITNEVLDLLRASDQKIIIDGSYASNQLYCKLIAALREKQLVYSNNSRDGTAVGASILRKWCDGESKTDLILNRIERVAIDNLNEYSQNWYSSAHRFA